MNPCPRKCGDCRLMSHHWIEDMEDDKPGLYACKHCDQRGDECDECYGDGCENCHQEGVAPL